MKTQSQKLKSRHEFHFLRKSWHITGVILLYFLLYETGLGYKEQVIGLCLLSTLVLALEIIRLKSKKINKRLISILGPFMRDDEEKNFSGLMPLVIGTLIVLIIFPAPIVKLSLLFLAFADPLASYIGIRYGKIKVFKSKTLEGFLSCWLCCSLIVFIFWPQMDFKATSQLFLFSLSAASSYHFKTSLDVFGSTL